MDISDVAAKGLDFPDVQHVINFDMPKEIETYVHREFPPPSTFFLPSTFYACTAVRQSECPRTDSWKLRYMCTYVHWFLPPVASRSSRCAVERDLPI